MRPVWAKVNASAVKSEFIQRLRCGAACSDKFLYPFAEYAMGSTADKEIFKQVFGEVHLPKNR